MAMFSSSEDELDSFRGSIYVVLVDTGDKLDEDDDATFRWHRYM